MSNDIGARLQYLRWVIRDETQCLQPIVLIASGLAGLLPRHAFTRVRLNILRAAGFEIGRSTLCDVPIMHGSGKITKRLVIGDEVFINIGCVFDLSDDVFIGDGVSIGHEVMILTSSHHLGREAQRAADVFMAPVTIGAGAWIGSRTMILPGVTIGEGAVVGAGAVVAADVPPQSLSAGVPAKVKAKLEHRHIGNSPRQEVQSDDHGSLAAANSL